MNKNIDQRVVEMRFDNAQFEAGAKESLSTLDKLKRSLNFEGAGKGLSKVTDAAAKVDVSPIGKGVDAVKMKFSAFEVVATTALVNLTNSAINTSKQLIKSLSVDQITSGWSKYQEKTSSVQALVNSTGKSMKEIDGYLSKLMWFSDETSYSFTEMTKALSMTTAAGGDIEKLIPMIMGVANATAYAGKGTQEFNRAMYNLNQSYTTGYLQNQDWKSLQLAGVATEELTKQLIRAGEEVGSINKKGSITLANFSTSLKDGIISREAMELGFGRFAQMMEDAYNLMQETDAYDTASEALEALSGQYENFQERAAKSAQEAKSFTEAIDATKDAVSSGWMTTFEIIVGNYEQAKKMWTDLANTLWNIFASGAAERNEMLQKALRGTEDAWDEFMDLMENTGFTEEKVQKAISQIYKERGENLDELIEQEGSLAAVIASRGLTEEEVTQITNYLSDAYVISSKKMEAYVEVLSKSQNGMAKASDVEKELIEAGMNAADAHAFAAKAAKGEAISIDELAAAEAKANGYSLTQANLLTVIGKQAHQAGSAVGNLVDQMNKPSGRALILKSISNVFNGFKDTLNAVKEAWDSVFYPADANKKASALYRVIASVEKFTANMKLSEKNAEKLKNGLKGVFSVFKLFKDIISKSVKAVFTPFSGVLKNVNLNIFDLISLIGDLLLKFASWVNNSKTLKSIYDALGSMSSFVIQKVTEFVQWLSEVVDWSDLASTSGNILGTVFQFIGGMAYIAYDSIKKFITSLINLNDLSFQDGVFGTLQTVLNTINGSFQGMSSLFTGITSNVVTVGNAVYDAFTESGGAIEWAKSKLTNIYEYAKEMLPLLVAVFTGASLIKALNGFSAALGQLTKIFAAPVDMMKSIKGAFDQAKKSMDAWTKAKTLQLKAKAIASIAISIGAVVAALAALAFIASKDAPALWNAAGAITLVVAALAALVFAMSKIGDPKDIMKYAATFAAIGIAIGALALAIKVLADSNVEVARKNAITLGALAFAVAGAAVVLSKFGGEFKKGALSILPVTLGIIILVKALENISKIDTEAVLGGILLISSAMAVVAIASKAIGNLKLSSGFGMLGIVASLLVFAKVLTIVADMDLTKLNAQMETIIKIVGMFAVLMLATRAAGQYAAKAGVAILAVSVSLLVIQKVIKNLSEYEATDLKKATQVIGILMTLFGGIIAVTHFAGQWAAKAAVTLLSVTASMYLMMGVIYVIKQMNLSNDQIAKALTVIGGLGAIFAALIAVTSLIGSRTEKDGGTITKSFDTTNTAKIITQLTIALAAMAAAVAVLAYIPDKTALWSAVGAVGVLAAALAAILYSVKMIGFDGKKLVQQVGVLLIVSGVMILLTQVVKTISAVPTEGLLEKCLALSMLILAIGGALTLMGLAQKPAQLALKTTILMTAVIGLLGGALYLLTQYIPATDDAIKLAAALSIFLVGFGAAVALLSLMKGPIMGGIAAAGVLGALAIGIGLVLMYISNNIEDPSKLVPIVQAIGALLLTLSVSAAILTAVGAIAALAAPAVPVIIGVLGGIMAIILALGVAAEYLTQKLGIDPSSFATTLTYLGQAIGGFVGGIIGGALSATIVTILTNLAEALPPFMDAVKEIDKSSVENLKTLAEAISALTKINFRTFNEETMLSLSNTLKSLGEAVLSYRDSVSTLKRSDLDRIKLSAEALSTLIGVSEKLSRSGGWMQKLLGEKDLAAFGKKMVEFGRCLIQYSGIVTALTDQKIKAVEDSANAGKKLIDVANLMPRSGGYLQKIIGEKDLSDFGKKAVAFGKSLVDYAGTVEKISPAQHKAVADSVNSANQLVDVGGALSRTGGVIQDLVGEQDIEKFGKDIVVLGEGIRDYATTVSELPSDADVAVYRSRSVLKAIQSVTELINDSGGIKAWLLGEQDIEAFGKGLSALGIGIERYLAMAKNISVEDIGIINGSSEIIESIGSIMNAVDYSFMGVDPAKVTDGIYAISSVLQLLRELATIDYSKASDFASALEKLATEQVTNFDDIYANHGTAITEIGYHFGEYLDTGLRDALSSLYDSLDVFLNETITQLQGRYEEFKNVGIYIASGVIAGIQESRGKLFDAGADIYDAVDEGARKEGRIESPSKEMIEIGKYIVMGLEKGLEDNQNGLDNAGVAISKRLLDTITSWWGINSPSKVARDSIGRWIVSGIAEGINKNTSAEEAAQKKAQNILSAFQDALKPFQTQKEIADLEYEIKVNVRTEDISDRDKAAEDLDAIQRTIDLKKQEVIHANAAYQGTIQKFGENSTYAQDAYKALLQAEKELTAEGKKYNKSLEDYMNSLKPSDDQVAFQNQKLRELTEWSEKLDTEEYKAALEANGLTKKDMLESIYDVNKLLEPKKLYGYDKIDVKKMLDETLAQPVEVVFRDTAKAASKGGASSGNEYIEGAAGSIENGTGKLNSAVSYVYSWLSESEAVQAITNLSGGSSGLNYIAGAAAEISNPDNWGELINGAKKMATDGIINPTKETLDEHSPSKVAAKIGAFFDLGLAKGIKDTAGVVDDETTAVAKSSLDRLSETFMEVSDYVNENLDAQPSITPVINLDELQSGLDEANGLFSSRRFSFNTARVATSNIQLGRSTLDAADSRQNGTTTNYNFTQNNYSPKALSRIDIYRNTKNLVAPTRVHSRVH